MEILIKRLIVNIGFVCLFLCQINILFAKTNEEVIKQVIPIAPIDSARVKEIVKMLPDKPKGFGHPIEQREVWDKLASKSEFQKAIKDAEKYLNMPFPAWDDKPYLEYSTIGTRPNGEKMLKNRGEWLPKLVWAECLENKGRFLPTIELVVTELINQKSWVLPAHDKNNINFEGKQYTLDLNSAGLSAAIAQSYYLLNSKLSPVLREKIVTAIRERTLKPILQSINTGDKNHWYLTNTNNWTSVCLMGLSVSALAVIPSKYERAVYMTIAERYIKNFVNGFSDDGYCDEGLGYYYYGYENYMVAREIMYQNTDAKVDLFADAKCKKMALFSSNLEILNGIFPTIGDCRTSVSTYYPVEWYNSQVFGLGKYTEPYKSTPSNLMLGMMLSFPNSASNASSNANLKMDSKSRSYFDKVGVLICRPDEKVSKNKFGAALVAGSNDESHNHNDVGSFTVVVGDENLMGDPGGPYEYNNKTFSSERYTLFKSFASFGHPVPLVAKKEQIAGKGTQGKVLKADFTPSKDTYVVDLKNAYKVDELTSLVRNFVFDRTENGSLTVTDVFEFTKPSSFEIAFTTRAEWKQINETQIEFAGKTNKMIATITAPCKFTVTQVDIDEKQPIFHRLGITLNEDVKKGEVKVVFKPVIQ